MEIINLDNSNTPKWAEYVEKHPNSTFYHRHEWKEVIEKSFGHKTYYLMAFDNNEVIGILPMVHLKSLLFDKYHRLLNSDNDVEVILNIFAHKLAEQKTRNLQPEHIFKAVEEVYEKVKGSYSVVAYIAEQGLVAFRDPFGIKPLVYGRRKDGRKATQKE